jgi:hypothetical protein
MSTDIQITTEVLYRGALMFAILDAIYIPLLIWRIHKESFRRLKWWLVIVAACFWYGIWSWALGTYWESVYSYVFPARARIWVPWIAFSLAAIVALGLWASALAVKWNTVFSYCLFGGMIGILTHIRAVHLGIVTKPPMLRGASPLAAIIVAFFEFIFYWCTILLIAKLLNWLQMSLRHKPLLPQ